MEAQRSLSVSPFCPPMKEGKILTEYQCKWGEKIDSQLSVLSAERLPNCPSLEFASQAEGLAESLAQSPNLGRHPLHFITLINIQFLVPPVRKLFLIEREILL